MKNVIMMTIAIIAMAGCDGVGFEAAQVDGTCDQVEDDLTEALGEIEDLESIDWTCAPVDTGTAGPETVIADVDDIENKNAQMNSIIIGLRADLLNARNALNEFNADLMSCESELNEEHK